MPSCGQRNTSVCTSDTDSQSLNMQMSSVDCMLGFSSVYRTFCNSTSWHYDTLENFYTKSQLYIVIFHPNFGCSGRISGTLNCTFRSCSFVHNFLPFQECYIDCFLSWYTSYHWYSQLYHYQIWIWIWARITSFSTQKLYFGWVSSQLLFSYIRASIS